MKNPSHYFLVWRWHFYAGLFIAPFLIILALTGLGMVLTANTTGRDLDRTTVTIGTQIQPLSEQAKNAIATVPDGKLVQYIAPRNVDTVALFRVKSTQTEADNIVLINPYTADVVESFPRHSNLYHTFDNIHGDMLLGSVGDYLYETAASLTILMILTGLYLWWQRKSSVKAMLIPDALPTQPRRQLWQTVHGTLSSWIAVGLLFFCISGLAWAGIWGAKMVQAWSQFPAGKWGVAPMPESTLPYQPQSTNANEVHNATTPTHGETLNDGNTKEVPWALELTPMPKSTPQERTTFQGTLDTLDQQAKDMGFVGRYQLNFPKNETGVWTLSQDSMSYDMTNPLADRTVHIDQYSGQVLADIRYSDYSAFGKFMAAGIALHMGTLGFWSILANVLFCLAVIVMCISGYVMWWQRRPNLSQHKPLGLNPPPAKHPKQRWWQFAVVLLFIAALFPTALIAIITIALLDFCIISRSRLLTAWLK